MGDVKGLRPEVGSWVRREQFAVGKVEGVSESGDARVLYVTGGREWLEADVFRVSEQHAVYLIQAGRKAGLPLRDDGTLPIDSRAVGVTPDSTAGQTFDIRHTGSGIQLMSPGSEVITDPPETSYLQEVATRLYPDAFVRVFVHRVIVYRPLVKQDQVDVVKVAPVLDIHGPKSVDATDAALRTLAGEPPGAGAALGLLAHWQEIMTRGGPKRDSGYYEALEACMEDVERAYDLPGPQDPRRAKHEPPGAQAARALLESWWSTVQIADATVTDESFFKAMTHCISMLCSAYGLPNPGQRKA